MILRNERSGPSTNQKWEAERANASGQHVLPNFFPPANLSPDEIYQRLLPKVRASLALHRWRRRAVVVFQLSFSPTFGYFNWPRGCRNRFPKTRAWFTARNAEKKRRAPFLRWYPEVVSWYRSLKRRASRLRKGIRGDRAIKMERGGEGDYLDLACEGEGKNGGGRWWKKGRDSLFSFFRVPVGHVQNLNHPRFVLLAGRGIAGISRRLVILKEVTQIRRRCAATITIAFSD